MLPCHTLSVSWLRSMCRLQYPYFQSRPQGAYHLPFTSPQPPWPLHASGKQQSLCGQRVPSADSWRNSQETVDFHKPFSGSDISSSHISHERVNISGCITNTHWRKRIDYSDKWMCTALCVVCLLWWPVFILIGIFNIPKNWDTIKK